jgi:HAE1 family hydrophobic/amphiphilic exporter-1
VGDVIIFGERRFAMRLWLDPVQLASRRLTAGDVVNALREQNIQVAAGAIGSSPAASDQMFQISVRAEGRLIEASEFDNVVVKTGTDGALVRVRDVGRAELGAESYSSRLRFGGLEASGMGIRPLPGANAIEVFDAVRAELDRLRPGFPPGLDAQIAFDNARLDQRSPADAGRSHRPCRARDVPVPAELAQHRHSGRHDSGLAHRDVRVCEAV